jgi:putative transposase
MPRKARIILSNTPHHIVQRGHNRNPVFVEPSYYQYYLASLREWKQKLGVKVYGYCLMTNHVHLILDPGDNQQSIAALMKRLAGRQTRFINRIEHRTGSAWEGRYRSSAIETDTYLLACTRYVEMNPVRADMVSRPEDYIWSSYQQKTGREEAWIDNDSCYLGLADSCLQRQRLYRNFVEFGSSAQQDEVIRQSYRNGWLTGTDRFIEMVQARTGIRIEHRGRGRPGNQEK